MALDYTDRYPGQVDTGDPNFPHGKAQDISVEGDGSGTPFQADIVNDIWGFLQAILVAAALTPSGLVDNANVSQYLSGLELIFDANNVTHQGVQADGIADDTAAMNAAIAAAGAGDAATTLFCPPGIYRFTDKLLRHPKVSLRGVPGRTIFKIDDPSNRLFSFESGTWTGETEDFGLTLEAAQTHTGDLIYIDPAASTVRHRFSACAVNRSAQLAQGNILYDSTSGPEITFDGCHLVSGKTATSETFRCGGRVQFLGGELTMAPAATADLISGSGDILLSGVRLTCAATVAGNSFVNLAGLRARIIGCALNVSGLFAYLINVVAGGFAQVSGCDLAKDTVAGSRYKYTSGPLTSGSSLQMFGSAGSASASKTIDDDFASADIAFTAAAAPNLTLPHILVLGQTFDAVVRNNHGSGSWGSDFFVFNAQGTDAIAYSATGLDALASGSAISIRFLATRNVVTDLYTWMQIGAHQLLT